MKTKTFHQQTMIIPLGERHALDVSTLMGDYPTVFTVLDRFGHAQASLGESGVIYVDAEDALGVSVMHVLCENDYTLLELVLTVRVVADM
jgi:hypothetical protein